MVAGLAWDYSEHNLFDDYNATFALRNMNIFILFRDWAALDRDTAHS